MVPLEIRDLVEADLSRIAWSGSPTHLEHVRAALQRAQRDEVEFLAVVDTGDHVAVGAADLVAVEGAAKIWMLTVHPDHRSKGLGTALIEALEQRIRKRGFETAVLSVEKSNPRAKSLYDKLGWHVEGDTVESWIQEGTDGTLETYTTDCWVMSKGLTG